MGSVCVLGSCRVLTPARKNKEVVVYPGGRTHTLQQTLQAIQIMSGEVSVPKKLIKYVFVGYRKQWKKRKSFLLNLDKIKAYVIEISSLKNYKHEDSDLFLHSLIYFADLRLKSIDVVSYKDSYDDIQNNLMRLWNRLGKKPFLLVSHNNMASIPERKIIIDAVSHWAKINNQSFVDPTKIIKKHGIKKCLDKIPKGTDYNHYTSYMRSLLKPMINEWICNLTARD